MANEQKDSQPVDSGELAVAISSVEGKIQQKLNVLSFVIKGMAKELEKTQKEVKSLKEENDNLRKELAIVDKKTVLESSDGSIDIMSGNDGGKDLSADTDVLDDTSSRPKKVWLAGDERDISGITLRYIKVPFDGGEITEHEEKPAKSDEYEVFDLESPSDIHVMRD